MKKCAKCNMEMRELNLLSHKVDFCNQCKSVFLDKNELNLVKNGDVDGFEEAESFGQRPDQNLNKITCPGCASNMRELVFAYNSGIHIDRCDNCEGIFLDEGELLAIDNFLEKVDEEDISNEVAKNLKTEKAKVDANFEMMEAENDKLYKVIDEIPGIKYVVDFLSFFIMR